MATVVENQIACDNWLYGAFGKGSSTSYACPPKSVITGTYGLQVSGTYTDTQLVKQSDISLGLMEIPLFVIFNWHNVPYSSRWVKYQGRQVMPIYCNVRTDMGINTQHGLTGDISAGSSILVVTNNNPYTTAVGDLFLNTSKNSAGDFQALPMDSSNNTKEYCMNMDTYNYGSPSYNGLAAPANAILQAVTFKGVYVTFYDSSYNPIGTSGSVTTNFGYRLSIGINYSGWWEVLGNNTWSDQYGYRVTGSMVGYSDYYYLDTGNELNQHYTINTSTLSGSNRGIALMFDFYDMYGGSSGDSNSSW